MKSILILIVLLLLCLGIVLGPIVVIWALNTLGMKVDYNFWTWLAGFVLILFFGRGSESFKE